MALLDFLKRKKEIEKSKPAKVRSVSSAKKTELPAKKDVKKDAKSLSGKVSNGFSYDIVKEPHISEKATYLAQDNKYVFKIYKNSNKLEVKKSIEGIYKVDVLSVNIIKAPKKKRRIGRTEGFKKGFKKALVTIKEGQKIEIF